MSIRRVVGLEAAVEKSLRDSKLKFVKGPVVGNTQPDFLVTTDGGHQIVVEVKGWQSSPDATARAIHQAQRYKELSNADAALIVTSTGESVSLPIGGVVSVASLQKAITNLANRLSEHKGRPKAFETRRSPEKKVFASMPFSSRYDDTFLVEIVPAALDANAIADRVDHAGRSGDVVRQIKELIATAHVVVADLSASRPNVCHEVGYAEALGKPVVQICSTKLDSLPFNLRNNQTIQYSIGQASRLKTKLERELRKVL
jgi:hypothetical protein